jgi:hypothetical protein
MTDNITVTPGSGVTVLADGLTDGVLGAGIVQFVKLMDGTLDSANKLIVTAAGAVGNNPALLRANSPAPFHAFSGGTSGSAGNGYAIKASAGILTSLTAYNTSSTIAYLKIYDSATTPTLTSATGLKHVIPLGNAGGLGAPTNLYLPALGEGYANGIYLAVVGGGGDTDGSQAVAGVFVEGSFL